MLTLDSFTPTLHMVNLIAAIEAFRGSWRALQNMAPERLTELRHVATIESIGSSTRIEGSQLSDRDVDKLWKSLAVGSFATRDEQEVAGYAEVMDLVLNNWMSMPISEATIRQLHRILLGQRPRDDWHRGGYKNTSNSVAAFDPQGRQIGVVFETADPLETPQRMAELIEWTNRELDLGTYHPLFVIGAFIVVFLQIHPFQDGNGRMSRILTTLLMLRAGYSYVPYSSMESVIERNKGEYYRSLRATQGTLGTNAPNWSPWLEFFLETLDRQAVHLKVKAEHLIDVAPQGNPLDLQIVEFVRQRAHTTMSDILDATGANRNTLKGRLRTLVANGKLLQHEGGRRTWYSTP